QHAEPLHHRARAAILRHGEGHHFGQIERLERKSQALEAGFSRETLTPAAALEAPADLDARCERSLERWGAQSHETDECRTGTQLRRPKSPSLARDFRFGRLRQAIAFGTVEAPGEELHHRRVGVEARERLTIARAPLAQRQTWSGQVSH